jgi:hypothetical protein
MSNAGKRSENLLGGPALIADELEHLTISLFQAATVLAMRMEKIEQGELEAGMRNSASGVAIG